MRGKYPLLPVPYPSVQWHTADALLMEPNPRSDLSNLRISGPKIDRLPISAFLFFLLNLSHFSVGL